MDRYGSWRTHRGHSDELVGLPRRTTQRHDAFMRLPWNTPKIEQLDLVDEAIAEPVESLK